MQALVKSTWPQIFRSDHEFILHPFFYRGARAFEEIWIFTAQEWSIEQAENYTNRTG